VRYSSSSIGANRDAVPELAGSISSGLVMLRDEYLSTLLCHWCQRVGDMFIDSRVVSIFVSNCLIIGGSSTLKWFLYPLCIIVHSHSVIEVHCHNSSAE
jgi:hypothetical protein